MNPTPPSKRQGMPVIYPKLLEFLDELHAEVIDAATAVELADQRDDGLEERIRRLESRPVDYESPQAGEVLGVPGAGTPPPEGARLSEEVGCSPEEAMAVFREVGAELSEEARSMFGTPSALIPEGAVEFLSEEMRALRFKDEGGDWNEIRVLNSQEWQSRHPGKKEEEDWCTIELRHLEYVQKWVTRANRWLHHHMALYPYTEEGEKPDPGCDRCGGTGNAIVSSEHNTRVEVCGCVSGIESLLEKDTAKETEEEWHGETDHDSFCFRWSDGDRMEVVPTRRDLFRLYDHDGREAAVSGELSSADWQWDEMPKDARDWLKGRWGDRGSPAGDDAAEETEPGDALDSVDQERLEEIRTTVSVMQSRVDGGESPGASSARLSLSMSRDLLQIFDAAILSERARNAKRVDELRGQVDDQLVAVIRECLDKAGAPPMVRIVDAALTVGAELDSRAARIAELESKLAEKERAPDADPDTVFEELKGGGPWLAAARKWSYRYAGDSLKWDSREEVRIPFVELWDLAQTVAEEAIREERRSRARETLERKDRWALEQKVERLESQLEEAGKREEELKKQRGDLLACARLKVGQHQPDAVRYLHSLVQAEAERDTLRRERDESRTDAELKRQAAKEFQRLLGDAESQLAEVTRRFEGMREELSKLYNSPWGEKASKYIDDGISGILERFPLPTEGSAPVWRDAPDSIEETGLYWLDSDCTHPDWPPVFHMKKGDRLDGMFDIGDRKIIVKRVAGPVALTEPLEPRKVEG